MQTWDKQFRSSQKKEQKIPFLYLANDILQNSKRTGTEFVGEFWKVLPAALKDVIENGDAHGKNVVSRLVRQNYVINLSGSVLLVNIYALMIWIFFLMIVFACDLLYIIMEMHLFSMSMIHFHISAESCETKLSPPTLNHKCLSQKRENSKLNVSNFMLQTALNHLSSPSCI